VPAIERAETLAQATRWDVQKSRAMAVGLCETCAGQYSWGLQIGFTLSKPPCRRCAAVLALASGAARPNGWRNLRLTNVGTGDTGIGPHAHRSRNTTPARYVEGFGECGGCGAFWTGFTTCHCSGCHQTFVDARVLAAHQIKRRCQDPQTRGLVKITRAYWTGWGNPAQARRLHDLG
jgi:hypothetical protein